MTLINRRSKWRAHARTHARQGEEEQNLQSASSAGSYSGPTRQCGGVSVAEPGLVVGDKKEADVAAFATSAPAHRAGLTRALCSLKNAPLLSTVA